MASKADRLDKFAWAEGDLLLTQCVFCSRKKRGENVCDAFPDGIPDEILRNDADHRKPFKGDRGVRFNPKNEKAKREIKRIFSG